jgi:uncharacterized protein (TIGR02265 family)
MLSGGDTMVQVKGSVLRARVAFVEEVAPEGGVERVLARLSEEERGELRSLLATRWYPFELGRRLDEAIVAELGGGRAEFFERLGVASAEKNLSGVHRGFLSPGNPHGFLERAPLIYAFYYDRGRREYERTGPTEGVLTTYGAETFSIADCATVVGWHKKGLEMCGAQNPEVVEEECRARGGAVCRYRVSWS